MQDLLANSGIMLALLGYFGYILKDIPNRLINLIIPRISFSISFISSDTNVYNVGNEWINSFNSKLLERNMQIKTSVFASGKTNKCINYGTYYFFIDRFTVAYISKALMDRNQNVYDNIYVRIFGLNQKKYINILVDMMDELYPKDSVFLKYTNWNGIHVKKKYFEDIFAPEKERIVSTLTKWLGSKELYEKHGIQYKLGILLYGKPGTGKSSIARAIASYLDWEIITIDLKTNTSRDLIDWVANIGKKKVVILEDIDCVISSREDGKLENSNFDTLLNILDGSLSPNNVIFVATTNYIEKLDPAFIRDGRFDCKVELKDLPLENALEMCAAYKENKSILEDEVMPINPAYLQNKLLTAAKLN